MLYNERPGDNAFYNKLPEYNIAHPHSIVLNNTNTEKFMEYEESEQTFEMEQDGIKVVIKFPSSTEADNNIRHEVKCILSSALQEYLHKIL